MSFPHSQLTGGSRAVPFSAVFVPELTATTPQCLRTLINIKDHPAERMNAMFDYLAYAEFCLSNCHPDFPLPVIP